MKKLDRSLKEYCLVEYACDRDWNDNELLRNYRAEYNRHLEEEKWEEARIKQNEAEIEEEEEVSIVFNLLLTPLIVIMSIRK